MKSDLWSLFSLGTPTRDVHTYNEKLSLLVDDVMTPLFFDDAEERLYKEIAYYSELLGIKIDI